MVSRAHRPLVVALSLLVARSAHGEESAPAATTPPAETTTSAPQEQPAPPVSSPTPAPHGELHHAPVSFANAHQPLEIRATIDHPELVRRALLVYRSTDGEDVEVAFERAPEGPYVAVIPEDQVDTPVVAYAIEIEDLAGKREPAFAARNAMYTVQIADEAMDSRERALLTRVGGRRSVISAYADYVSFGTSDSTVGDPATGGRRPVSVADRYYRFEGAYTYRLFRTVEEFSIRIGIVRGSSPVSNAENEDDFNVGLNYGAPSIRLRLVDFVHLDASLLASVTEVGYSAGGGGALHLGDVYGSELELGFEVVGVFGNRFYSRVDVATNSLMSFSAIVEATNMPHASRYGVRLLGEVSANLGAGFSIAGRGGYQARDSASGGPAAGVTVAYAF